MIEGKTKSGFDFTLDQSNADDWELLEAIRKSNDDSSYAVDVAMRFLGDEQYNRLKEHVRVDGKVKISLIEAEVAEMMEAASKN